MATIPLGDETRALLLLACQLRMEETGRPPAAAPLLYEQVERLFEELSGLRIHRDEADKLARETWEALEVKPLSRQFVMWRQRIEEALSAGATVDQVRKAGAIAGGVTQAMWDRALNIVRAAPRTVTPQERTVEAQRARVQRQEKRREGEPERMTQEELLAGTEDARRALQDAARRRAHPGDKPTP
jgi:hypothetical protein